MAWTTYVTNNYNTWIQDLGLWSTLSPYTLCTLSSDDTIGVFTDTIRKSFTIPRAANVAQLTVANERVVGYFDEFHFGISKSTVTLIKPDASEVILYQGEGALDPTTILNAIDITAHLATAGTYHLEFTGRVSSARLRVGEDFTYDWSICKFTTVLLRANTDVPTEIILGTETTTPTDILTNYGIVVELTETPTIIESFQISVFAPPVAQATIICVGTSTDNGIYTFRTGQPVGYFDTPEIDFSVPGKEKTLEEIQFELQSSTPHTVSVYVSLNGGQTWVYVGQDTIQAGKKGFVHPWLTAESFIVRFHGTALYLFSYGLYAIPAYSHIRKT